MANADDETTTATREPVRGPLDSLAAIGRDLDRYQDFKIDARASLRQIGRAVRNRWKFETAVVALALLAASGIWLVPWPTLQTLKSWQQGIGALVGFVALAGAALINYALMRRRDARLRREYADGLRVALIGELHHLERRLREDRRWAQVDHTPADHDKPPNAYDRAKVWLTDTETPLYESMRDRLDRLTPLECRDVVAAYKILERNRAKIRDALDDGRDCQILQTMKASEPIDLIKKSKKRLDQERTGPTLELEELREHLPS